MARKKFMCPQCGVPIRADGKAQSVTCHACGYVISNAAAELGKSNASNDLGINVIKYEGDNSTFVWKHPVTDFNIGTMLIVHESQEAVFYSSGQILDTFGPGRHVLKTAARTCFMRRSISSTAPCRWASAGARPTECASSTPKRRFRSISVLRAT